MAPSREAQASASWHLYVVRTVDGALYTGIATDVERRYEEHLSRSSRSARYLRAHPPSELVLSQLIGDRSLALKVEHHFKRLARPLKQRAVEAGELLFDPETGEIRA